jgi:hypothetical protein
MWQDAARTTPAVVDGPVGSIQDELLRYYAEQATSTARPMLRSDGAGRYWLEADGTKLISTVLGVHLGDALLIVGARQTLESAVNETILSNWRQSDAAGQSRLYRNNGDTVRYDVRQAGSSLGTIGPAAPLGDDFVGDGRWSDGVAICGVNGVDSAPNSVVKIGTEKGVGFFGAAPNATPQWEGRLYCAAIAGIAPTAGQLDIFRRWAASRCVDNPL